jgi:bifunctional oligoribonuclease and PAP phosphatase NrnA
MSVDWRPLADFVARHQRFLIMTHIRPDGDALGSQLGLACGLRSLGKTVYPVIASNVGPRYRFLDPDGTKVERHTNPPPEHLKACSAIIIVDTGAWAQIGDFGDYLKIATAEKVVIDHHRSQDDLGATRFVDTSAEAAGRLVYDACMALGCTITAEAASYLYMAIATDTGWFRHAATKPSTLTVAAKLMEAGADPTAIYDALYENNTFGRVRLIGRFLERLKTESNGAIGYGEVYLQDFEDTGSLPPDTEDLINYPRSVAGVEVALIFIEQKEGAIRVSFRSRR